MQGGTEPERLDVEHVGCLAVYAPFQRCSQMLQALLVQKAESQGFSPPACSLASARGRITVEQCRTKQGWLSCPRCWSVRWSHARWLAGWGRTKQSRRFFATMTTCVNRVNPTHLRQERSRVSVLESSAAQGLFDHVSGHLLSTLSSCSSPADRTSTSQRNGSHLFYLFICFTLG